MLEYYVIDLDEFADARTLASWYIEYVNEESKNGNNEPLTFLQYIRYGITEHFLLPIDDLLN